MASFTFLWTNECRVNMMNAECEGVPLDCSVGNAFRDRYVTVGDFLYVLAYHAGETYLIGRMQVGKIYTRAEWLRLNPNPDLWDGNEVIGGINGTPMRFHRVIALDVLKRMTFLDRDDNPKGLTFDSDDYFNPMALRSVRRITDNTARLLDTLL